MNKKAYFAKMTPFALIASVKANIPVRVILAQWAHESGYGTSSLAQRANNHGGIKYTDHADFKSGAYSGYDSLFNFANDYARVMQSGYYDKVRKARGVEDTVSALGNSAYAEDTSYAAKIGSMIKESPEITFIPLALVGGLLLLLIWK